MCVYICDDEDVFVFFCFRAIDDFCVSLCFLIFSLVFDLPVFLTGKSSKIIWGLFGHDLQIF